MTPEEAIEILNGAGSLMCQTSVRFDFVADYREAEKMAIKAINEVQKYREIGTVEQVKNQKENLNVAHQIISDYEQYGTIEDFKKAQRYMRLVKAHGTIGQVIDFCAEYEEIGTVEECREAVEKQKPKNIVKIREGEYCCPKCYTVYDDCIFEYDHCINCGQAIKWGTENLEGMEDE